MTTMMITMMMAMMAQPLPPMRDAPIAMTSARSMVELQACVTRQWSQAGSVSPVPSEHGVDLDFYTKGTLFGPGQARLSLTLAELGDHREISARYRHPLSAKAAARWLAETAKKCFPEALNQPVVRPDSKSD